MAGHANFLVCAMRVQTRCEQPQSDASPVLTYSQKRLVAGRAIQVSVMSGARAGEPASVRLEASGSASQAEEVVIQHVMKNHERFPPQRLQLFVMSYSAAGLKNDYHAAAKFPIKTPVVEDIWMHSQTGLDP